MRAALPLLAVLAAAPAGAQQVGDALASGDLICEFRSGYQRSLIADLVGEPPVRGELLVFESLRDGRAEVLSTRAPGRRPVVVRASAQRVHFIEPAGPSVRVTTLTGCALAKWKNGAQVCVRFEARHAWHFDALAFKEPDASFERQPSGALPGTCEPWRID
jgi:hypothetical protein